MYIYVQRRNSLREQGMVPLSLEGWNIVACIPPKIVDVSPECRPPNYLRKIAPLYMYIHTYTHRFIYIHKYIPNCSHTYVHLHT